MTPEPSLWSLEWWKDATEIAQSALVCVTAIVALLGINEWHRQTLGRRKIELSEQVLASFYEARDVFVWVRSPAAFAGEGESRQAAGEDDDARRRRNTYFVPIERMQKHSELFAKLQSQRYSFMAIFGAEAVKPFDMLRQAQVRISVSAGTLIRMVGNPAAEERNKNLWDRCEGDIWDGLHEAENRSDPIKELITSSVDQIEGYCRPVLLHSGRHIFQPKTWFKKN